MYIVTLLNFQMQLLLNWGQPRSNTESRFRRLANVHPRGRQIMLEEHFAQPLEPSLYI